MDDFQLLTKYEMQLKELKEDNAYMEDQIRLKAVKEPTEFYHEIADNERKIYHLQGEIARIKEENGITDNMDEEEEYQR